MSIALILLKAVIFALTAIEKKFIKVKCKDMCNAVFIHRHSIQHTVRLKYSVDNFMKSDLSHQLLFIVQLNVMHCRDY